MATWAGWPMSGIHDPALWRDMAQLQLHLGLGSQALGLPLRGRHPIWKSSLSFGRSPSGKIATRVADLDTGQFSASVEKDAPLYPGPNQGAVVAGVARRQAGCRRRSRTPDAWTEFPRVVGNARDGDLGTQPSIPKRWWNGPSSSVAARATSTRLVLGDWHRDESVQTHRS